MNTIRHNQIETPYDPKAEGRPCCYCGKERPAGRRRWCSQDCVDDFLVRKGDQTRIRWLLKKRDHETCAKCGLDTRKLDRILNAAFPERWRGYSWRTEVGRFLRQIGIPPHRAELWDADHIVPVIEGGGGCGLDNYRTLCLWCHKDETAALAKRRAKSRQDSKRPLLQEIV